MARKGDIVVVFDGFATPTLLRPMYRPDDGPDDEASADAGTVTQKY